VNDRFIGQAEKFLANPLNQGIKITAGQIGSADRAGKEDVTDKQVPITQQADSTRRMPRKMKNTEGMFTNLQGITLFKKPVRFWRRGNRQTVNLGVISGILQQRQIRRMKHQFGISCLDHLPVGTDMVKMGMGIDNLADLKAFTFGKVQDSGTLFTWVDYHRIVGFAAPDQKAVYLKWADTELMYYKSVTHHYYPVYRLSGGRVFYP
jgi:hypothetical protein